MLIVDAHQDIAYNALELGRDIRLSVHTTRRREARIPLNIVGSDYETMLEALGNAEKHDVAMSGLPELRRGGFGVIFGVIFAHPLSDGFNGEGAHSQVYRSTEEAYRVGQGQLSYYRQLAEEPGITLIRTREDLQEVLMAWESTKDNDPERPLGLIPLMEGADPIRAPGEAASWFENGLRIVGPSWSIASRYCGGNAQQGSLTTKGTMLLREMEHLGLILDVTHMAETAFWQAMESFQGSVIASHSNCRAITMRNVPDNDPTVIANGQRHLSDDMIRALAERGAVIGVVPFNRFLDGTWTRTHRFDTTLDLVVRHIDHICQLTGSARHVGLGSDIDGGFGRDETPLELDTVADMVKLADALHTAGYQDDDIVGIMGGNWCRFMESALPSAL
ncbi:MAG TPA: membrane dipeptidase [Ktedonobacteraceae bacterium]|jgi:membrane dipeptidase